MTTESESGDLDVTFRIQPNKHRRFEAPRSLSPTAYDLWKRRDLLWELL
jgi:hypothetical protein